MKVTREDILDVAVSAPEPPAWWFSARSKTHPKESGLARDAAWRISWAKELIAQVQEEPE